MDCTPYPLSQWSALTAFNSSAAFRGTKPTENQTGQTDRHALKAKKVVASYPRKTRRKNKRLSREYEKTNPGASTPLLLPRLKTGGVFETHVKKKANKRGLGVPAEI